MLAAGRQQAHDRQPGHRLAAAGLADQAERLAGVEMQVDAVDRPHQRRRQLDVGLQTLDVENRRSVASSALPQPDVDGVAQRVANEVERHDREDQADPDRVDSHQ